MRVLVTGGRGLLGSAVVRELVERGHAVTTFQRSRAGHAPTVRERLGDVSSASDVAAAVAGAEAVVNLAARVSMVGPWSDFVRVNVDGTRTVVEQAQAAGVARLVHISSPSVAHAGEPLVGVPATPADPAHARGSYARSKAMAELIALESDRPGFAVTALRPHLVWGPGDTQLVGRIADRARRGRLVLVDDGAALIDTTYVVNAADAIAQALDRCDRADVHGRAFVVSNGEPRTVAETLGLIARAAGAAPPTRKVPSPPLTPPVPSSSGPGSVQAGRVSPRSPPSWPSSWQQPTGSTSVRPERRSTGHLECRSMRVSHCSRRLSPAPDVRAPLPRFGPCVPDDRARARGTDSKSAPRSMSSRGLCCLARTCGAGARTCA